MRALLARTCWIALVLGVPAAVPGADAADICKTADAKAEIAKSTQSQAFKDCTLDDLTKDFVLSANREIGALRDLYMLQDAQNSGTQPGVGMCSSADAQGGDSGSGETASDEPAIEACLPGFSAVAEQMTLLAARLSVTDWSKPGDKRATLSRARKDHDRLRKLVDPLEAKSMDDFAEEKQLSYCWIMVERMRQQQLIDRLMTCSGGP